MLTQTVALTSVCSDSLESAFPFPTQMEDVPPTPWCGLQGFGGNTLGPAVGGNTHLEVKCWGVSAPLNEGWGINSGKTFLSAKTAEKPQLEQVGRPQDVRKEEETAFVHSGSANCSVCSDFSANAAMGSILIPRVT